MKQKDYKLQIEIYYKDLRKGADLYDGKNGKSSGNGLDFWLGTASDPYRVYPVRGEDEWFGFVDISTDETAGCGLRPVIEISKSSIL